MSVVIPLTSLVAVPAPQIVAKRVIGRRTRRRAIALAVMAAIGLGVGGLDSARADLITPAGLVPGDTLRYIYVTTETLAAPVNGGSATVFDNVAISDAAAKGYDTSNGAPVTWHALISTTTESANDLVTGSGNVAFYLPNGTEVAASAAALFATGLPAADPPVPGTPLLTAIGTATDVWTGATSTGGISDAGSGNSDGSGAVGNTVNNPAKIEYGDSTAVNGTWLDTGNYSDNPASYPVYAFSSVITVAAPVPEPASLGLLAAAAVPLALGRKRRSRQN